MIAAVMVGLSIPATGTVAQQNAPTLRADFNGDGEIGVFDALRIPGYSVGRDVAELPAGHPIGTITLSPDSAAGAFGGTVRPHALTDGFADGRAEWRPADASVATGNGDGFVREVAEGEVTIVDRVGERVAPGSCAEIGIDFDPVASPLLSPPPQASDARWMPTAASRPRRY